MLDPGMWASSSYGRWQVSGTVTRLGVAGAHHVCAFHRGTHRFLKRVAADESGNYTLDELPRSAVFLVAFDRSSDPVNAAASDWVHPSEMAT